MRHPQGFRFSDSPVRDQGVGGSNPLAPTIRFKKLGRTPRFSSTSAVDDFVDCGTQKFHPCSHLTEKLALIFCTSRENRKSDRNPSQFGCLCAILAPHVTLLPQRGAFIHFVLWLRFRFDGRWASFPLSDRPFTFSPRRGSPVSAQTPSLLCRCRYSSVSDPVCVPPHGPCV